MRVNFDYLTLPMLLTATQIRKRFGDHQAVDGVDITLFEGQCLGLLGPNGAGKSTTLEMLEGVQLPDSGSILFAGHPLSNSYREQIGIQFQQTALPDYLTVRECIELFSSFYHQCISVDELVALCDLGKFIDKLHFHLSGGQRQRLLLALSLVNQPRLLFLDEPTTGLDPVARAQFWETLKQLKAQGLTMLLTTHYMDEAAELCDRTALMNHGKIVAEDTPQALLKDHFAPLLAELDGSLELPSPLMDQYRVQKQSGNWTVECGSADELIAKLTSLKVPLRGFSVRQPNLNDLFIKLTGQVL